MRTADEVAAERLETLDILKHNCLAGRSSIEPVGLVAVEALEEKLLAVEVDLAVLRLDLADAKAS